MRFKYDSFGENDDNYDPAATPFQAANFMKFLMPFVHRENSEDSLCDDVFTVSLSLSLFLLLLLLLMMKMTKNGCSAFVLLNRHNHDILIRNQNDSFIHINASMEKDKIESVQRSSFNCDSTPFPDDRGVSGVSG